MPWIPLPFWLIDLTQAHFWIVCVAVCCASLLVLIIFEKLLINSGQFGRNALGISTVLLGIAACMFCNEIYRSADRIVLGQRTPSGIVHEINLVGITIFVVAGVLFWLDKKD